ncbi:MAG: TonB-dependent receptor [Puia sp.]|nr:TonB-dependent receptor [Puia sp.]
MRKFMGRRISFRKFSLTVACLFCFLGLTASATNSPAPFHISATVPLIARDTPGTVRGKIVTSDEKPGAYVTVRLVQAKTFRKTTVSDEHGLFEIRNVPDGDYTIEISLVGASPVSRSISIKGNYVTEVDLRLNLTAKQLQEVVVTGDRINKFASKESDYVAKMPLKDLENPQVTAVVTKELMKDQLVTDIQGALQNTAGGSVQQNPDRTVYIMMRGFEAYGLLRNGISTGQIFDNIDPVNIERLEILKGPSATLFGTSISSYGGVINRVTKKPYDHFGGEIGYAGGQWGLSRFTMDINTALDTAKTALLRVNAAVHDEGSFQDAGSQNSWIIAPSLLYKVNDRFSLSLDVEAGRNNSVPLFESGFGFQSLTATKYSDIRIPYNSSLIGNDTRDHIGSVNVFAGADYKLSDKWVSHTIYAFNQQLRDAYNLVFLNFTSDTTLSRLVSATRSGRVEAYDLQQNFNGQVKTGAIKHRLLLGFDYYSYKIAYPYAYFVYDNNLNFTQPGTANMSSESINSTIAGSTLLHYSSSEYTLAAYATDVINFTDNLIGMAAVRLDHFAAPDPNGYKQNAVSPKFGLIYQPVKNIVSLFVNYLNGFQNQSGSDFFHHAFKPQQANQWEEGVKLDLFDGKLSSTVSYYDILLKDIVRPDPNPSHQGSSIQDGTQRSKGFEVELTANPLPGLNLVAGYGYNENVYVTVDTSLKGKSPVESPRNSINEWISYKIQRGRLKGLIFGFGMNFVSMMYSYLDQYNKVPLPSYAILRATISYDQPKYSVGLRVNNLASQKYWNTNGEAQAPRQISGVLSFRF